MANAVPRSSGLPPRAPPNYPASHPHHKALENTRMHTIVTKTMQPREKLAADWWYCLAENRAKRVTVQPHKAEEQQKDSPPAEKVHKRRVKTDPVVHVIATPTIPELEEKWMTGLGEDVAAAIATKDLGKLQDCCEELEDLQAMFSSKLQRETMHYNETIVAIVQKKMKPVPIEELQIPIMETEKTLNELNTLHAYVREQLFEVSNVEKANIELAFAAFEKVLQNVKTMDQLNAASQLLTSVVAQLDRFTSLVASHYIPVHKKSDAQNSCSILVGNFIATSLKMAVAAKDVNMLKIGLHDAYKLEAEMEAQRKELVEEYDEWLAMTEGIGLSSKPGVKEDLEEIEKVLGNIHQAITELSQIQKEIYGMLKPFYGAVEKLLANLPVAEPSKSKQERMNVVVSNVKAVAKAVTG